MSITARAEHVGSLLRPPELLDARKAYASGELSPSRLKATEDAAVRGVLGMQEEVGCPVVTDGELRRESFQSELVEAASGFEGVSIDAWLWGEWHSEAVGDVTVERPSELAVVDKIHRRRNLAAEEFTFVRACTSTPVKVTLPSPTLLSNLWAPERSAAAYPTLDDFMADVLDIFIDEVRELQRLGCTYVQLDAPHYPLLIDPTWRDFYEARGWSVEKWLSYGIECDNAVMDAAPGLTFGFHLCRGNQGSRWLVSGGYDAIAAPVFGGIHADRLLLEYDDDRSGSFDPLRLVPPDKAVVLGLVTTKTPRLESVEELMVRVDRAAELIERERLAIGTQCGFSTSIVGNALTIEDERRKLALVVEAAGTAFGEVGSGKAVSA
jgi:5-methyltetrahydropteroyltriglutamate--homocysteine methyltransferase